MHLELCGVERIMATSLPLSLLVTPPSNQASHGSAGYFCKYVYHVFRGGELERRTNGVWQRRKIGGKGRQMAIRAVVISGIFAVDPWAPNVDSQSIASLLFAASLFPYLGFLYHITKSQSAPKLTLFGFYFLLAFVGATIPAGIYGSLGGIPDHRRRFFWLRIFGSMATISSSIWGLQFGGFLASKREDHFFKKDCKNTLWNLIIKCRLAPWKCRITIDSYQFIYCVGFKTELA